MLDSYSLLLSFFLIIDVVCIRQQMYAKYGVISLDVSNENNTNTLFILKLRHFFQNHGATKAQKEKSSRILHHTVNMNAFCKTNQQFYLHTDIIMQTYIYVYNVRCVSA